MKLKKSNVILFMLAVMLTLQVILIIKVCAADNQTAEVVPTVEATEATTAPTTIPVETTIPMTEAPTEAPTEATTEAMAVPRIDCKLSDSTQQMILDKCAKYDIDFAFTMAIIFRESTFNPNANSGSSHGLMQINEINHPRLNEVLGVTDFFDPAQNVESGLFLLRELFDKYEDPTLVLMAYNMGETGASRLWNQGIYTSDYAEAVLQTANKYQAEINERMGENDQV